MSFLHPKGHLHNRLSEIIDELEQIHKQLPRDSTILGKFKRGKLKGKSVNVALSLVVQKLKKMRELDAKIENLIKKELEIITETEEEL